MNIFKFARSSATGGSENGNGEPEPPRRPPAASNNLVGKFELFMATFGEHLT